MSECERLKLSVNMLREELHERKKILTTGIVFLLTTNTVHEFIYLYVCNIVFYFRTNEGKRTC